MCVFVCFLCVDEVLLLFLFCPQNPLKMIQEKKQHPVVGTFARWLWFSVVSEGPRFVSIFFCVFSVRVGALCKVHCYSTAIGLDL